MSFIEFLKKNNNDSKGKDINADKAFMSSIAISFFAIIVCIVLLSASTFAWFTTSIESENTITSSVYKLDIGVNCSITDGTEVVDPVMDENGNPTYQLNAGKTYTVTVTALTEGATGKTGYIKMRTDKMADGEALYSEQIDRSETISFTIKYNADALITIIECWGTSSKPDSEREIHNGVTLTDTP